MVSSMWKPAAAAVVLVATLTAVTNAQSGLFDRLRELPEEERRQLDVMIILDIDKESQELNRLNLLYVAGELTTWLSVYTLQHSTNNHARFGVIGPSGEEVQRLHPATLDTDATIAKLEKAVPQKKSKRKKNKLGDAINAAGSCLTDVPGKSEATKIIVILTTGKKGDFLAELALKQFVKGYKSNGVLIKAVSVTRKFSKAMITRMEKIVTNGNKDFYHRLHYPDFIRDMAALMHPGISPHAPTTTARPKHRSTTIDDSSEEAEDLAQVVTPDYHVDPASDYHGNNYEHY